MFITKTTLAIIIVATAAAALIAGTKLGVRHPDKLPDFMKDDRMRDGNYGPTRPI